MNTSGKPPIDEAEWQAQERGMRAAREGDALGMNGLAEDYAIVARALVSPPRSEPPADFAADVAEHITRHEAGRERLWSRILLAASVLASIVVCARYGGPWWQPLRQSFDNDASGWMLAVAGCVALSWAARQLLVFARLPGGAHRRAS